MRARPPPVSAGVRRDRQRRHRPRGTCAGDRARRACVAFARRREVGGATPWLPVGLGRWGPLDGTHARRPAVECSPALDRTRPARQRPGLLGRPAGARCQVAHSRRPLARTRFVIPSQNIVAWANVVPWVEPRQVEQDLVISRALVEVFSDHVLRDTLRFRGGTALNKLHFPSPVRYSEDIDLVRTSTGPIGSIVDRLRAALARISHQRPR